ncbi:hypothetical protein TSAR_008828 [Trichomalopsis sarcophagae]|uniref:Uncharacterized protein n=1 Tax=Trichomalopsis sarcophagae TaxID=543379 RepID=A0A232F8A1_9HYME|nr:hypothetical protein TSAR_008828 [Trichomalopsis sarcophagae]
MERKKEKALLVLAIYSWNNGAQRVVLTIAYLALSTEEILQYRHSIQI